MTANHNTCKETSGGHLPTSRKAEKDRIYHERLPREVRQSALSTQAWPGHGMGEWDPEPQCKEEEHVWFCFWPTYAIHMHSYMYCKKCVACRSTKTKDGCTFPFMPKEFPASIPTLEDIGW
eukprot:g16362.t1